MSKSPPPVAACWLSARRPNQRASRSQVADLDRLVSAKVMLFALIVSIAAHNRVKLMPRLTADGAWDDFPQSALERL